MVRYLEDIPSENELKSILDKLNIAPIDLIRKNETVWKSEFKNKNLSDDELISVMVQHPKLIERPIVVKGRNAVVGRPTEAIATLL